MLTVIFMCFTNSTKAESFTITKSGNEYLSNFFPDNSSYFITDLKIIGEINVYDIKFLQGNSTNGNLTNLDLSEVTFVDVNGIIEFFQEHNYKDGQYVYGEDNVKKIHERFPSVWKKSNNNLPSSHGTWRGRYYRSFIGYDIEYTFITWEKLIFERTPIYNGLDAIPSHMFDGCEKLKSIILPPHITKIGDYAFNGCKNLEQLTIPSNVKIIGDYAFEGCEKLQDIVLPQQLSQIGTYSFENCKSLTSIIIPDSVKSIERGAFKGCSKMVSAKLPDNLETISFALFQKCGLKTVNIPKQCTKIETYAFDWCQLDSVILYEKIKNIGSCALFPCPNIVYSMSEMPPTCEYTAFSNVEFLVSKTLYVPKGCVERYSLCPVWKEFGTILEMPESMGIETVTDNKLLKKRFFTIDGKEHTELQPGINIIKYENGQSEKIYVK